MIDAMTARLRCGALAMMVTACSSPTTRGADAAPPDARASDASTPDASTRADAATIDGGEPVLCADAAERHRRADLALSQFLLAFWRADAQYLRAAVPGDELSAYWVYAQAFDAVLDGAERTEGRHYHGWIEALAQGQARRGWSSDWYDDENWLALALIRAFDLTGDREYLSRARTLFEDIQNAWDESCCGDQPGGIWWDRAHTQKATASNGGPVITAVRLAARTGEDAYLAFARQVYSYWRARMVDPDTFQVADHIAPDGAITRWKFTYNEGVMVGAALELHRATGESGYLDDARRYAAFMREHETVDTELGPVLSDGSESGCLGDCTQFKGVGYRYLDLLERFDPDPEIAELLRASAEGAWLRARDPATGRFGTDWSAQVPVSRSSISQMSSALMALSLDASRCAEYEDASDPLQFEAEDGALSGVGLEASHAGFTGWAYLAGWNGPGQVALTVRAPSAGRYRIVLRYAAAAGDARRRITVGDRLAAEALTFPGTPAWDAYSTVEVAAELPEGASRVGVSFEAGSAGFLNLDHLRLVRE